MRNGPQPDQDQGMVAPLEEPLSAAAKKTTLAALIMLAMFVISGSVALYTGYLLWRGEAPEPVMRALPGDCDAVLYVDPKNLKELLVRARAIVPEMDARTALLGLDGALGWHAGLAAYRGDAYGVCRRGPVWYAALGAQAMPNLEAEVTAWVDVLAAHTFAWRDFGGRKVAASPGGLMPDRTAAAVRSDPQLAQAVWLRSAGLPAGATADQDAGRLLDQLQGQREDQSLQADKLFRDSLERTGGGQAHVFVRGDALRQWVSRHGAAVPLALQPALDAVQWSATAFRLDGNELRVHDHVFGGQRLASWLKQHLDVAESIDFTSFAVSLPAHVAWGVVRAPVGGLATVAVLDPAVAELVGALPCEAPTTRRLWTEWLTGQFAWAQESRDQPRCFVGQLQPAHSQEMALPATLPPPQDGTVMRKLAHGYLIIGRPAALALCEQALTSPGAKRSLSKDQQRLAEQTQGWSNSGITSGQTQFEWTWLDSGLVVEQTYRLYD